MISSVGLVICPPFFCAALDPTICKADQATTEIAKEAAVENGKRGRAKT